MKWKSIHRLISCGKNVLIRFHIYPNGLIYLIIRFVSYNFLLVITFLFWFYLRPNIQLIFGILFGSKQFRDLKMNDTQDSLCESKVLKIRMNVCILINLKYAQNAFALFFFLSLVLPLYYWWILLICQIVQVFTQDVNL